jgi:biotin carboxylase
MKKIAIIGASYLQLPLIEKSKDMGLETHVFAWAANDVGEAIADYFYPISIVEKEEILKKCQEIGIDGICSIASDLAIITVNYIAESMGLVGNSITATEKSTNKHRMRNAFKANGDPSPRSTEVDKNTDLTLLTLDYPVIVKPTDRSGSRGIYKLDSAEGLEEAVNSAIEQSFEKKALIEEFADGKEYSVEYISWQGQHYFLAVTEKFTTGAPHFIETGHREPAPIDTLTQDSIKRVVEHAIISLEIQNGASHSEIKIDSDGKIKIIEIGGRMGGDCIGSDLVYYSTGIDFVKAVIDVALGNEPDLTPKIKGFPVEVHFIFSNADITCLEKLKNSDKLVKIVSVQPELIGGTTDSSNRAGCYILKG